MVDGLILSNTQAIPDWPDIKTKRETTALNVLEHGTTTLIENFMPNALSNLASEQTKNFLHTILEEQQPTAIASALRGMALRKNMSSFSCKRNHPNINHHGRIR